MKSGIIRGALKFVREVDATGDTQLSMAQAKILSANGENVHPLLSVLLNALGDDNEPMIARVTEALELADALGYDDLVQSGLLHRFAAVREQAMLAISGDSSGPLPASILALAADKGSGVRRSLLSLLAARHDGSHLETVIKLAGDTWTDQYLHPEAPARYPIARIAAEVLLNSPEIPDALVDDIGRTARATQDEAVKLTLLRALVRTGSDGARQKVMRLALKSGSSSLHRLSARAMLQEAESLEVALVAQIAEEKLIEQAALVALPLTLLIGLRGADEQILSAAKSLAAEPARHVLVLPLLVAAAARCKNW